jgi:FKBP-type peptidyl-prolyl cis-trans isomerase 2
MTAADAEEGAVFYPFPEVKGTVVSVEENVVVTFAPVSDEPWKGRFGTSTVIDKGDHFEIDTDVQVGRLVRVGPLLGRISEVEREKFKVDYGHAFGGEELVCDVRVEEAPEGDVSDGIRTQLSEALNARMKTQEESNLPKSARRTELASPASAEDCDKIENSRPEDPSRENSELVQLGDLVTADFTASLETGEVVGTTWPHVIDNPDTETVDWYEVPEAYMPETFVAGEEASVPGLGNAVLGMHAGETRHLVLPPERAYGQPNMRGVKEFDRVLSMPKIADISVEDYKKRFGGPPSKGHVVDYNPYVTAEVLEVSLQSATLALTPRMKKDESEIGTTEVRSEGDKIELILTPKIGAPFRVGNSAGKIVSSDPKKFAVDFNHPMAGKKLVLDVYVHSLKKAATLKDAEIAWVEDHNSGLETARKEDKPVVMVLYAEWCKWCKRMFNETFTDIRVQRLKKDFVWLKVNSDKDKSLKGQYGQQGYPLTVILDSEGQVIEKLPGFQTAQGLAGKLDGVLETFSAASSAKVDPRESGQRDQQI